MKPYTAAAALLLALVALLHLLRVILGWEVSIDGAALPMWPSVVAVLIAGGLSLMVWRERLS